ncbi:MAG: hypothetical protein EKK56_10820 [Flavobacteriaceae bacterium]|nr:MAG: hypothetical protein EKK56_10820 [Flavobacteriaceae bacterium]
MNNQRYEFRLDIEDFQDKEEVLQALQNVLNLVYDNKLQRKLNKELGDREITSKKKNITFILSKINNEELPF